MDQATGWLASVWYDARNAGAANNKVELWGTVSFNGGVTWQPNFKISGGHSDGRQSNTGNPNGTTGLDIYFSRITVATPEPSTCALMAFGLTAVLRGVRGVRRKKVPQEA